MEEAIRMALRQSLEEVSYELSIMDGCTSYLLLWVEILEPKLEKGGKEKMLERLEVVSSASLHPQKLLTT
jgi:hypothetical protein